ncbi:hypothetical protein B5X24_HaOG214247, partial [Helicoverpa armigera]
METTSTQWYTISTGDRDRSNCCSRRSPSYRVTKPSIDASADPAALPAHHLLEPSSSVKEIRPQLKGPRPIGSSVSDSISLSSPVACTSPREDPLGPPMPSNVAALPEEHRCCLLGKVPGLRVRRRRAMLIYVCAADSQDCCAEKGALQCGAAARLRVRARRRGWRVHVADLHWRSPLEQQRDHRFPVLCIAELARQSELGAVVPVLFLNSGLGTPLLPHTLECADFKAALETAEDESDKALLNKWYTLDASTTPPCYRLVRGAPARWRREMAKTLNVLVRTLPQEACDAYLTTVVEQSEPGDIADTAHHHELQRRLNNLQKDLKQHLSERNKAAQCTSNREITLNELKTYITGDSTVPLALIGGAGCGKATLVARADVYSLSSALVGLLAGLGRGRGALLKTGAASPPEAAVKAVQKCTLPLYAKILAWQISLSAETFTELSEPETTPELVICEDLEDQLAQILITTEAALGAERVKTCLSLLTASRRGLDDTEILDILAHDELFRSEETYLPWAPASLVWPQLAALLSPWLRWDARGAARWRDAALASAASDRYLADCDTQVRQTLIDYYEGKWYAENDPKMAGRLISQENKFSDEYYNTRKLDELPFQHYHIYKDDPKTFANQLYFTQLDWVHDKLAATDCCHFLEDIALVHIDPLPEHIEILKDVFETHSYALDYDHRQFYGLLRMTMEKRQRNGCQIKSKIVQDWMKEIRDPPVPTLYPENPDFYKIMECKEKREFSMNEGFDSKMFDLIVRFDSRGKFVATVSTEREEICVWDVLKCKLVRKMVGVTHPINLVPIDEYKCVVLCRRELRVYNLDQGTFLVALKGVMNQKMPCKLVRKMVGVTHPINLVPIDEYKCVVLCRRELRVYNLDQGTFLVALKGVMNQKMPYYGLHDPKHLVALSRNRMYVNLMNIET